MKEKFIDKRFSAESMAVLQQAVVIIENYKDQGYELSLRQLYYQLVSRNIVPNTEKSYKRVGDIISDARMAGLVDWDMIEDRNRHTSTVSHWDTPGDIIKSAAYSYRIDKWATQPCHCEVMVEKQALEGVLEPVCRKLDIPFTANKGYSSVTMMYNAGKRLARLYHDKLAITDNPRIVVFYLGDHDPSGIDMTRDVRDRLRMFSDVDIEVKRLALNMDQIEELNPPENPAKMTDSRAADYVSNYGMSSWELDAVEPKAMAKMVTDEVLELRDPELWAEAVEREDRERGILEKLAETANKKAKVK